MRFIFRADASRDMGSGHVMRISVLASQAISKGYESIFVGSIEGIDWVNDRISNTGFSEIHSEHNDLTRYSREDVLIIDGYHINPNGKFITEVPWKRIVALSDPETPNFGADMKVIPGFSTIQQTDVNCRILSGPKHLLIRKEISKIKLKTFDCPVQKILVVGGGSDPYEFARTLARTLDELTVEAEVHFFSQDLIVSESGHDFRSHKFGSMLDQIANDFDLVLTTASTICFEFIAREIPIGVAKVVENQKSAYEELGELGYAIQVGERNEHGDWTLNKMAIEGLISDSQTRATLHQRIQGLVDLNGAQRVFSEILKLSENVS